MKENENKEQSKTAGAARQGGDTNNKVIGSAVSTAVGEPVATESKITDTDSARAYIAAWHREHFPTDRAFTNYIMGRNKHCALAGDFAWQLAKALESLEARLAAPTQAKPVDLSEIKVYGWTDEGMVVGEGRGKWCKFADVKRLSVSKKAARIGCEGTGKSVGDMPCLGCDACPEFAAPTQVSAPQADELSISRQKLNMAKIDVLMDGARASSEEFRDGVTFGANSLHMKMLELAGAPQASAAQEVLHEDVEWLLEAADMARRNPEHATKIRANCKAGAAQEVRAAPGRSLDNLGGAIKMAVNMLSRDGTPARIEAAGALIAAFGEVAEQVVASTSTAPAAMDEGDAK